MRKATAAVVERTDGPFTLTDIVLDEPRTTELLVRITAVGMCHTDLSVRAGATPFPLPGVLGHEGAGVVEAVGDGVTKVAPGDQVLISFTSCGKCVRCLTGRPSTCVLWPSLNLLGGMRPDGSAPLHRCRGGAPLHGHFFGQSSFASHALTNERNVVKVAAAAPLELLAPLGCGVQTGAGSVFNVLRPQAGGSLAVFGAGAVGLSAVLAAANTPVTRIIVVDLNDSRLALARRLGATELVNGRDVDVVQAIRDITGDGVHYALETTGSTQVLRQAVDALSVGGTCGVVGAPPFGSEVRLDVPQMLVRNPKIVGINQGNAVPDEFLPTLMTLHALGKLPVDELISPFPFHDIETAAEAMRHGDVIKPVLRLA
ncbi:NAD(P)-dependent alcohol dehydrogenase [Kibdelosporangium philippinense]|uniref:NAD(P)-dependent alcohol dehydrogenase n=1 Tax=Kibdelosporangium philippinense TaxID=211113 RepID=A0ABS8Z2L7_9PSEU|nr:NAD(P)-dependent alcohol dehydrogenase [Kibdelosporangium philippinense]MCE7002040.1 NAD(P)-dependent alcohol dehydrogenase [Kibdelosporangium philippinense]